MNNQAKNNKYKIKRENNISIKVTDDELALIHLYASKKPHSSISEYVRDKALRHHARTIEIKDEDLEKLRATFSKLKEDKKVEENVTSERIPESFEKQIPEEVEENELRIEISEADAQALRDLAPMIASNNGFTNYREAGDLLLRVKALGNNI